MGQVLKMQKENALELMDRLRLVAKEEDKFFGFVENEQGEITTAGCKFSPSELVYVLEHIKLSLITGGFD